MFLIFLLLQVAIKNNIDVFYFACLVPMNIFFTEDGQMDKRVFLATWKDIPAQNEVQYTLSNIQCNAGIVLNMSQSSWLGWMSEKFVLFWNCKVQFSWNEYK